MQLTQLAASVQQLSASNMLGLASASQSQADTCGADKAFEDLRQFSNIWNNPLFWATMPLPFSSTEKPAVNSKSGRQNPRSIARFTSLIMLHFISVRSD